MSDTVPNTDEALPPKQINVDWESEDDLSNPKNWSFKKRMACTIIIALFTLFPPLSSSIVAPSAQVIAEKFHITRDVEINMLMSIFVLALAFGPFVWAPLSELYGRRSVVLSSNVLYFAFSLAGGFAKTESQMYAFRFLAGFGGSAPMSVGGGLLSDVWRPEERGIGTALYSLGPLLGPVIGPIIGAWMTEKIIPDGYKYTFYLMAIMSFMIEIVGFFFLSETFAPVLLKRKSQKIKKGLGITDPDNERVITVFEKKQGPTTLTQAYARGLTRPFAMLGSEPIIQIFAVYLGILYGCIYLIIAVATRKYMQVYNESLGIASLNFIASGLGLTISAQIQTRYSDKLYNKLVKNSGKNLPEYRLPFIIISNVVLPIGLLLFGWGLDRKVHWIMPDIGFFMVSYGLVGNLQLSTMYLIDTYTLYAASCLAAAIFLRSLFGFAFPLFADYMFNGMGFGWGCTLLSLVCLAVGQIIPITLWFHGENIRGRSRFTRRINELMAAQKSYTEKKSTGPDPTNDEETIIESPKHLNQGIIKTHSKL